VSEGARAAEKPAVDPLVDLWELSEEAFPAALLERLADPDLEHASRRRLVIEAEFVEFSEEQERELLRMLLPFIEEFRDSNDREDQIAVGSAIRTYVALMDDREIGTLAGLLECGHRGEIPLEIELELVKTIRRVYEANPDAESDKALADILFEKASAYLNPNVMPRNVLFGAVALNAVQALVGMSSPKAAEILDRLNRLPFLGFRQQLKRRLNNLTADWDSVPAGGESSPRLRDLRTLVAKIEAE